MLTTTTPPHPSDRLYREEAQDFPGAMKLRIQAIALEISRAEHRQPASQMSRQNLIGLLWQYREEKLCKILLQQYVNAASDRAKLDSVLAKWESIPHTKWYAEVAKLGNFRDLAI